MIAKLAALATVLVIAASPACGASGGGNTAGLPDGQVKSKTYKPASKTYEICVHPEGAPTRAVKCATGFTKDEVSGCHKGSYWPDCYHLPTKKAKVQ